MTFVRSFFCVEYQIMIFWGRLSVQNTRLWPLEVIFLHGIVGYVICLCGIPDYDLLRSFVHAEYQIVTSWGHISVWDSGLCHLSVWNTGLWSFEVVCLCEIPDCDLLRPFVRAEYQIVTSWGHISAWDSGLCHLSVWNTGLWSFEVICPCGIPDCDLLRSYFCMG